MIDLTRLKNVVQKDGKTVARCPACEVQGGDSQGNHLIVYANGKYGCIKYPKDKEHNRQIQKIAGGANQQRKITVQVNPLIIPRSKTIILGHLGLEL